MAYKRELIINNGSLTSYKKLLKVSDVCQLLDKRTFNRTTTISGVTCTNNGDGTFTLSGTATQEAFYNCTPEYPKENNGHIFYVCANNATTKHPAWGYGLLNQGIQDNGGGVIGKTRVSNARRTGVYWYKTVVFDNVIIKPQIIDLTEMYGAGNEPATVDEFKAKFPNDLYDYSPRCWVKSYKTGLIAKTKNLFNWSGKLREDYDAINCTIVETLTNGAILQGNIGSEPGTASFVNGWFRPGYTDGYGTAVTLSANDVVTISADYEILERNYASPTTIGVYLYGTEEMTHSSASPIETGVLYRIKNTYTITKDGQYYPVFTLNSSKVKITNIQIEKGSVATHYVPYGYL